MLCEIQKKWIVALQHPSTPDKSQNNQNNQNKTLSQQNNTMINYKLTNTRKIIVVLAYYCEMSPGETRKY